MGDIWQVPAVLATLVGIATAVEVWLLPARRRKKHEHLSAMIAAEDSPSHREALVAMRRRVVAADMGANLIPAWRFAVPMTLIVAGWVMGTISGAYTFTPKGLSLTLAAGGAAVLTFGFYRATVTYAERLTAARLFFEGDMHSRAREDRELGRLRNVYWFGAVGALQVSYLGGQAALVSYQSSGWQIGTVAAVWVVTTVTVSVLAWFVGRMRAAYGIATPPPAEVDAGTSPASDASAGTDDVPSI